MSALGPTVTFDRTGEGETDMEPGFSTGDKRDLLRYLSALDDVADENGHADADDVASRLGIDRETALRAERRLKSLGLIEDWPGPPRMADLRQRVLTGDGINAVLNGQLPI